VKAFTYFRWSSSYSGALRQRHKHNSCQPSSRLSGRPAIPNQQESCAAARKPRDAAAVLFGIKFVMYSL